MPERLQEQQLIDRELFHELMRSEATNVPVLVGLGGTAKAAYLAAFLERMKEVRRWAARLEFLAVEKASTEESPGPERQRPASVDLGETKLRELEQECDNLRIQNQLLQSRVAEARRTAARETQRYDQLQVQNDKLLDCLKGRMQAIDTTTALLLDQKNVRLRMIERYEGVVEHVQADSVTVVFEIDGDVIEHTYRRSQFIDDQLPEEGDRFTVYVHVVHDLAEREDDTSEEADELNEHREYERKKISGPIEF